MKQKRIKCPICKITYWSHTLKGHITNMGFREVYRTADIMLQHAKNRSYMFSPFVFTRKCPHYMFRKNHIKTINKFII